MQQYYLQRLYSLLCVCVCVWQCRLQLTRPCTTWA